MKKNNVFENYELNKYVEKYGENPPTIIGVGFYDQDYIKVVMLANAGEEKMPRETFLNLFDKISSEDYDIKI